MTKQVARAAALVGFFLVAAVALSAGAAPVTASVRGLVGAAAAYCITRVAMATIVGLIAQEMAERRLNG